MHSGSGSFIFAMVSVSPEKVAAQVRPESFRASFWNCCLGSLGLQRLSVLLTPLC